MIINHSHLRWDCHEHRDELRVSDNCTVYHPDHGQLCWWEVNNVDGYIIYHSVHFRVRANAVDWIKNGTIAELQEGMSTLQVGFSLKSFEKR